jgi:NAD(P)-dependent dehydrogenase (short-subunit alcohol dehydrogenase family)
VNVVITGASRGLGLALVARYATRPDAHVYALARNLAEAGDLHALVAQQRDRITPIAFDVADPAAITGLRDALDVDRIDLLINNAGMPSRVEFGDLVSDDLDAIFRVNVFAPLLITQVLAPLLPSGSRIVNISSVLGSIARAGSGYLAYGMSKAALNMLSRKLASELRPAGVAVLALHPGWVRTRMGGSDAALDIDAAVDGMVRVIDAFDLERSGSFLAYDGSELPW